MKPSSPRITAAEVLVRVNRDGAYSNLALEKTLEKTQFASELDRALCSRIVFTALERKNTLDFVIARFCKKPPDPTLRALLCVGIVQLLYMDKIPDSAACDETVNAAKQLTDKSRAGFVNAVLRNICRNKSEVLQTIGSAPEEVLYSLDTSILELLKTQYPNEYKNILTSFFDRPPMFICPNTLKTTADGLEAELLRLGCEVASHDGFMYVSSGMTAALSLISDGLLYVQGYASQYAVRLLGATTGDVVVDVCACPGGKTFGAALAMQNSGKIHALDIHQNKLSLITDTAHRLGIDIIDVYVHDGRACDDTLVGRADRVICDVPCSALGVIASRPEIRYKNVADLSNLIKTQYEILCAASRYLKPGGTLVYSTCTVNQNENDRQIDRFLAEHGGFAADSRRQFLPDGMTDGFYCCRIVKNDD